MGNGKPSRNKQYVPQLQRADWYGFDGRRRAVARGPAAGGPPASMFGAGVSMDEQGPTQAGGTLAGITAPGVSRDIIQSRFGPRIDLGPILRPRSTGANPLTSDPFQATSGVGGFFRRLLGDNADELNAQWQQARIANQLAAQSKADERAFEMEKTKLADQLTGAREAAGRDFTKELQGQQQGFLIGQALNKEIADSFDREAQRNFLKSQQESEHAQRIKEIEMRGETALDKAMATGKSEPMWKPLGDTGLLQHQSGKLYSRNFETGALEEVPMPGAGPAAPGGLSEETRAAVREKAAQLKAGQTYFPDFPREEPKIEQWNIPGEVSAVDPQITGMVGIKPAMSDDLTNLLSTKLKPKTKKSEYIGSSSIPKLW